MQSQRVVELCGVLVVVPSAGATVASPSSYRGVRMDTTALMITIISVLAMTMVIISMSQQRRK